MRLGAGDILLVSCYELGHQPAGLAYPLGFLDRAGYEARALDVAVDRLDDETLARPRFLGISVPMHTALRLGMEIAERARRVNPGAHVCFYGLYAPLNREMLLRGGYADSVLGGEYERQLVDAVRAVEQGREAESPPPALSRLPFAQPKRDGLPPVQRYARLLTGDEGWPAGYVEASRGCLHTCRHCPIPATYGGRFFVVERDVVLDDLEHQIDAGARHITFGDPDFLNGPGHTMAVARALHARHPAVTFDVTTKVEHVLEHRALFPELADLGCLFVVSAVESLSDDVLRNLHKGHSRADVMEALPIVEGAGIAFRPSFVPFTPWTTLEDYLDLVGWLAREKLVDRVDPIQLAIRLLVPPGSLLLQEPAMQPHLGELEPESLTYRWAHPDARMDTLQSRVQELVEDAAARDEPAPHTFQRIAELAFGVAGREPPRVRASGSRPAPRLSEAWFCCAEPTRRQRSAARAV